MPFARCGLLLQMPHVAWSVCLCVCVFLYWAHGWAVPKNGWTDGDAVCGADSCGSKEPCIRWGSSSPTYRAPLMRWQVSDVAFCQITLDTCYVVRFWNIVYVTEHRIDAADDSRERESSNDSRAPSRHGSWRQCCRQGAPYTRLSKVNHNAYRPSHRDRPAGATQFSLFIVTNFSTVLLVKYKHGNRKYQTLPPCARLMTVSVERDQKLIDSAPLCENMTSSTKPEVHNALYCRQN